MICNRIGIDAPALPHCLNGQTTTYQDAYDLADAQIVEERYAKEIEIFGYKF